MMLALLIVIISLDVALHVIQVKGRRLFLIGYTRATARKKVLMSTQSLQSLEKHCGAHEEFLKQLSWLNDRKII